MNVPAYTPVLATLAMFMTCVSVPAQATEDLLATATRAITDEITAHAKAYDDLRELTAIGGRLAASPGGERAVRWAAAKLTAYGFDNVTLQPMTTPVWTRGAVETATVADGADLQTLQVTALGGSIGTGASGLEAEVIEVAGLDEVERLGTRAIRGKIVFYNRPMDPSIDPFAAYGDAVDQRSQGAIVAARFGAVASIVRSLTTLRDDDHPHTGSVSYASGTTQIPAAAVSTHGANILSSRLKVNPRLRLRLVLSSQLHGMGRSYNVYADLIGSERPDEIVVVGAHLDSWDLGVGAHDDGAGVVQSIEALRAMKALGMTPKRTIRVVLFMSEEMGGYGARAYADEMRRLRVRHVAAIESDRGGFAPIGFSTDAGPSAETKLRRWSRYLSPLQAGAVQSGYSGTDVEPLLELGATTVGLFPESAHYFDFHHASTDQFAAVDRDELHRGAAAMAALAWLFTEDGL